MKKSIFAVMAFVVAAMLVGCSKDKENSEVAMTVSEITDSTAVINCEYSPAKSVSYKLQIGEAVSEEYRESMEFTISNLYAGTKYEVVVTSYDAEHNVVGTTTVNFRTTGEPNNTTVIVPFLSPQGSSTEPNDSTDADN